MYRSKKTKPFPSKCFFKPRKIAARMRLISKKRCYRSKSKNEDGVNSSNCNIFPTLQILEASSSSTPPCYRSMSNNEDGVNSSNCNIFPTWQILEAPSSSTPPWTIGNTSLFDTTTIKVEYSPTHTPDIEDNVSDVGSQEIGLNCTSFQESSLEATRNPSILNIPSEAEDPDIAFLMSFLPDLKKLNAEKKLEFQFQFLQCLQKISQSNNIQYNQNLSNNLSSTLNNQQVPQPQTSVTHQPYSSYSSNSYLSPYNITPQHHVLKNPTSLYHPYSSTSDFSCTNPDNFHPLNKIQLKLEEVKLEDLPNQHITSNYLIQPKLEDINLEDLPNQHITSNYLIQPKLEDINLEDLPNQHITSNYLIQPKLEDINLEDLPNQHITSNNIDK